jgi:hypothetical protein
MAMEFSPDFSSFLTSEQARLGEIFLVKDVLSMRHGDERYISDDDWWVDRDGLVWVNGNAPAYEENDLDELYETTCSMARVIYIDTGTSPEDAVAGWVIDSSHKKLIETFSMPGTNAKKPDNNAMVYRHKPVLVRPEGSSTNEVTALPVIAVGYDVVSMDAIYDVLQRQFDLCVSPNGIQDFINAYEGRDDPGDIDDEEDDTIDDEPNDDTPPSSGTNVEDDDGSQPGVA